MRRLGLAVAVMLICGCTSDSPTAPSPPPAAPTPGTAAAISLTPYLWDLPAGGGALELTIETSSIPTGGRVAAHVPVELVASSGALSASAVQTDFTGHVRIMWTGTSSATITAQAGDVVAIATIRVAAR